jgi:adenylate kinase
MKDFSGQTFCFLGYSGAGKDSQAVFLADYLKKNNFKTMEASAGERARILRDKGTAIGRWVGGILARGDAFPGWLSISLWLSILQSEMMGDEVLLLSSSPRRMAEAEVLDQLMKEINRPAPVPIWLDITKEEAEKRLLKRGRDDDKLASIRQRLLWFDEIVLPVLSYYGPRLIKIDGYGPKEEVGGRMMSRLSSL